MRSHVHETVPAPAFATFTGPQEVAAALESVGYLPDGGLATAAYLAMQMGRPLFLEGDPGVGKTALARALATACEARLVRLQCYEGIDAAQALYEWNFSRQMMHLRAAQSVGENAEESVYAPRFLVSRPILQALEHSPSVLLIDEIDRADDEFEAYLMEVLAESAVTIPELGAIRADHPPLAILTSNRTREVHDALKRRCLYHWVAQPDSEREAAIARSRLPGAAERLVRETVAVVQQLREMQLIKSPGVAETIDWVRAMQLLHADRLDASFALGTVGTVLKHREDQDTAATALQLTTVAS